MERPYLVSFEQQTVVMGWRSKWRKSTCLVYAHSELAAEMYVKKNFSKVKNVACQTYFA